jgi:hypothetical protein
MGNFVSTVTLDSIEGSVSDLELPSEARTAALWAEDTEYHISALTEAAAVR